MQEQTTTASFKTYGLVIALVKQTMENYPVDLNHIYGTVHGQDMEL
jgi:hypothetical protein